MSQRSQGRRKHQPKPSLLPPQWASATTLDLVREINESALDILMQVAQLNGAECSLDLVRLHHDLWTDLDAHALKRAARCPFLLVDAHFQSEEWWRLAKNSLPHIGSDASPLSPFPINLAKELMHETLVLAWHTARSNGRAESVLLAMSPKVATILARLGLRDIHRIATHYSHYLRPRWEDLPIFWHHLLFAAHSKEPAALHDLHLHGLQLLGISSLTHEHRCHQLQVDYGLRHKRAT